MNHLLATVSIIALATFAAPAVLAQGNAGNAGTGAPQAQQNQQKPATGAARQAASIPAQDRDFANQAALSNLAEIEAGKAAQQKASNRQVKSFADRMVKDHTAANEKLAEIAKEAGMTLPKEPDSAAKAKLKDLQALSGNRFDQQYIASQIEAHQGAIRIFEQETNAGRHDALKSYARETLPTLKQHLEQAQSIRGQIGGNLSQAPDANRGGTPVVAKLGAAEGNAEADRTRVQVQQPAPQVTVTQPSPDVTVTQPAPEVTVTQPRPEVTVQQPKPNVTVQQQKPQVNVEQTGQPEVNVRQSGRAEVDVRQPGQSGSAADRSGEPAVQATAGAEQAARIQRPTAAESENLIGRDVYGSNGNDVGEIENLLIGADGRVMAAVVEFGGFLGIGDSEVVVDWDRLDVQGSRVTVKMTEAEIEAAPRWDANSRDGRYGDATLMR